MPVEMEDSIQSCVYLYWRLASPLGKTRQQLTKFPLEMEDLEPSGNPKSVGGLIVHCPWHKDTFHADINVPVTSANKMVTPLIGGVATDQGGSGVLEDATKVTIKLLYGARFDRFDPLQAMNYLERYINAWTPGAHRCLPHKMMVFFVVSKPQQLQLYLLTDASFVISPESHFSSSSLLLASREPAAKGAGTFNRQRQAKQVAKDLALRRASLPVLQFWKLFKRKAGLKSKRITALQFASVRRVEIQ